MAEVHHERREDVAILTLDRPVSNALAHSLRAELAAALDDAVADDAVTAIVLCAAGPDFSTGVDVADYDAPMAPPRVGELCRQVELSGKPVVAALHGAVLGGGFELALAAHQRIAAENTRVGLPEITLGLIPNGGATQRLPRLLGAQAALDLMLSGKPISVSEPRLKPVIDRIVPGAPLAAAVTAARALAAAGRWQRTCDQTAGFADAAGYQQAVTAAMNRLPNRNRVEADIVDCVEAAQLLPFKRGLELEQVRFEDRRVSPDARARRHFRSALRRAGIMPEKARGRAREINEVLIPGSESLVIELAVACLDAGARVTLIAEDVAATEALRDRIAGIYQGAVSRGVLTAEQRDQLLQRLTADWPDAALARADLVLDSGQIDLRPHQAALNPAAIWVPVSSGGPMPVTVPQGIGGRHVEMRVYRPFLRKKLAELCVPPGAAADAVVTVAQFIGRLNRTVIRCDCVDGLVGGNMSAAFFAAALALAGAGLGPYRIDAAAQALGFARGPFRLMDEEGLPSVSDRLKHRAGGGADHTGLLAVRIAAGASGWPTGRGFYLYDDKGAHHDPALTDGGARSAEPGIEPRSALEVALVNEAARLLSAHVVQRASDIDVVMVKGFGFDPRRGGPLFQADQRGALNMLATARRLADLSEPLWQPHQVIQDMVKNGVGFYGRPG